MAKPHSETNSPGADLDQILGNSLRELAESAAPATPDFPAVYAAVERRGKIRLVSGRRILSMAPLAAAAVFALVFGLGAPTNSRVAAEGDPSFEATAAFDLASYAVGGIGDDERQGIDTLLGDYVESLWAEPTNI